MLLGALLLNAAGVLGIGLVARRRGGAWFAVAVLAGTLWLLHAFGPAFLRSPWTPNLVVVPFVLLALLSWSIVEGDAWALPWVALVASITVQMHLAPTIPIASMILVGLGGLALRLRYSRSRGSEGPAVGAPTLRRPIVVSAGVLAVVWLAPLVDAVTHNGGNVRALGNYFRKTHPTQTLGEGFRAVAHQLTIPPPWLTRTPLHRGSFFQSIAPRRPIPWIGVARLVAMVLGWRGRALPAIGLGAVALGSVVGDIVAVSRISGSLLVWDLTYVPATAMLASLATGYLVWSALEARASPRWLRPVLAAILLGALTVPSGMLAATSTDIARVQDHRDSEEIGAVAGATVRSLRGVRGLVLVRARDILRYGMLAATVVLLDQHGIRARVSPGWRRFFPPTALRSRGFAAVVTVVWALHADRYRPATGERRVAGHPENGSALLAGNGQVPKVVVFVARGRPAGSFLPN